MSGASAVSKAINVADLERLARRRLPRVVFDFLQGGAEDERTLYSNRAAYTKYELVPRILTGNHAPDLSVDLFGERCQLPFLIGPTGLNGLHWKGADIALAKAAAKAGTVFCLSTASNVSLEAAAAASAGSKWYQLYPWGDRSVCGRLMQRAREAGYRVLIVTVDSLVAGKRERDVRNGFSHELRISPKVIVDGLLHPGWLVNTLACGRWNAPLRERGRFLGGRG